MPLVNKRRSHDVNVLSVKLNATVNGQTVAFNFTLKMQNNIYTLFIAKLTFKNLTDIINLLCL